MKRITCTCAVVLFLASCAGHATQQAANAPAAQADTANKGTATVVPISNGIRLEENGLKVEEAHLLAENGDPIAEDNLIGVNDKIFCQMVISGYREINGKVDIGGSEEIRGEDGSLILQEKDLFAGMHGIDASQARYVRLMAVITELQQPARSFTVNFRIWDKHSRADVKGSYRFRLK